MTTTTANARIDNNLNYVRFDVGHYLYVCHKNTLSKYSNSTLAKYVAPEFDRRQSSNDYIVIDRDGKHFGAILNFMRDEESLTLNDWSINDLTDLMREADYYCLTKLVELCEIQFEIREKSENEPQSYQIPSSGRLEIIFGWNIMNEILKNSKKPVILVSYKFMRKFSIENWIEELMRMCNYNMYRVYCYYNKSDQPEMLPYVKLDNFIITLFDPEDSKFRYTITAPEYEKFRSKRAYFKCKIYKLWFILQNVCLPPELSIYSPSKV